jgi:spore maturation protein SpmA
MKAKCAHFAPNFFDMRKIGAMRQLEKINAQSTEKSTQMAQMRATRQLCLPVIRIKISHTQIETNTFTFHRTERFLHPIIAAREVKIRILTDRKRISLHIYINSFPSGFLSEKILFL